MKSLFRALDKNREWVYGTVHIDQTGRAGFILTTGIRNPSDYTLDELHGETLKIEVRAVDWNTLQICVGNGYVPYFINKPKNRIEVKYLNECVD